MVIMRDRLEERLKYKYCFLGRGVHAVLLLLILFLISGCGKAVDKVVNPYHGEFECPRAEKGKCVGIKEAYSESFLRDDPLVDLEKRIKDLEKEKREGKGQSDRGYKISLEEEKGATEDLDEISYVRKMYLSKLYETILKSFGETNVPLIIPPKVVRVVILPYTEGGVFYDKRQVFVVVDDYKWVLDQNVFER
ncbi:MAG: TraV family lipoprotein [Desulfurococcaceae archaeon]